MGGEKQLFFPRYLAPLSAGGILHGDAQHSAVHHVDSTAAAAPVDNGHPHPETHDAFPTCANGACALVPRAPRPAGDADAGADAVVDKEKQCAWKRLTPPKKIMKLVGQAVLDWNMIEEVCTASPRHALQ